MFPLKFTSHLIREHASTPSRKTGARPSVRIRRKGRRVFVLSLAGGDRKAIIKDITGNTHIRSPDQLMKIQEYILARDTQLARSMPRILAVEQEPAWIMMEYIEAPTLEKILISCLNGDDAARAEAGIDEMAGIFLSVNALKPVGEGLPFVPWRNEEGIRNFELAFEASALRRYLPEEFRAFDKFSSRFTPDFFSQTHEALSLVDCQPKNVLAPAAGPLRLIDLDYAVVNPALGVAQFLISLDRLGLRWPSSARRTRIEAWQRRFVAAYLQHADPSFAESLVFSYPSTLMRVCALHAAERPVLARYLRWYYGNRLNRFLVRLRDVPPARYAEALPDLFTS